MQGRRQTAEANQASTPIMVGEGRRRRTRIGARGMRGGTGPAMNDIVTLLPYIDQSTSLGFAVLIWLEIRSLRRESMALLNRLDERVK